MGIHPKLQSILLAAALSATVLLCSCKGSKNLETQPQKPPVGQYSGGAYAGRMEPDDGQWIRPAKDYASTRFSTLDQINTGNVKSLKVAWTFDTGTERGQEAAPLVVNNTMYIVTPWP